MINNEGYKPTERVTFVTTGEEKIDLKIMSILTKHTMSDFIRIALREKIKQIKENNEKSNK